MLRGLRNASQNWLGKLIMSAVLGILALSFAIWGVGDIFRGFGQSTVAQVGSTEISVEQFRQFFNDRLQQLGRQLGRFVSPEQARQLGLDRQFLGQLLAESAVDERARQLGLNLPDDEIRKQIVNDPAFRGANGQFDRFRFEQTIRQAGYTEGRFVAEQRRVALRRQLADTVAGGVVAPQTAMDVLNRFTNEERAAEFVVLGPDQAGEVAAPDEDTLTKFFESRKTAFRAPEYRKAQVLALTPQTLAGTIEITDADVQKEYETQRSRYVTPERREVQQMVLPNAQEAQAVQDRLKSGASFAEVAAERGLKEADTNLGLVAKSGILDPAVANAAFALPAGGTSEPVQGRFGTVIVHVGKIEPEQSQPLDQVAGQIRQQLAEERARAEILDMHDKIEDERASGQRLDEIATKLNLPLRTIEAIDRSGRGPDGAAIADVPGGTELVNNLFVTDVGVENDPIQQPGGGFIWYEVAGVTPARDRTLDEVRSAVETRWREEQVAERVRQKADAMLEKVKGGTSFAEVAAADNLKVETTFGLKRGRPSGAFSAPAVEALFRTAKDAFGTADGQSPGQRIVFKVTDVTVPTLDPQSEDGKRIAAAIERAISDDLLAQYIMQVQSDLGARVNQDALNRALGVSSN